MSNIHPLRGGEGEGGEEEAAAAALRPVESVPNYVHKLCYVVEVGVTPRQLTYLNATGGTHDYRGRMELIFRTFSLNRHDLG